MYRRVLIACFVAALAGGIAAPAWASSPAKPATAAAPAGAAAQATASTSYAASLASTSDASGNVFLFWKGQDDNLWSAVDTAGSGTPSFSSGPTAVGGMWPLGSEPSALSYTSPTTHVEYVYVFWKGTDDNLWYAYGVVTPGSGGAATSVGSWDGPLEIGGLGPLGSAPSAAYVPEGALNGIDVFWKGTDDNLWSAVLSGPGGTLTKSSGPTNLGDGPLGSAPSAGGGAGGNVYVFWEGTGNNTFVWEAYYNAGATTWSGPLDLGPWTSDIGSQPSVTVGLYDRQILFWRGLDGNLYTCTWNGYWTSWVGLGMGPLNSAPAGVLTTAGSSAGFTVVWKGTDLDVWSAVSPPGSTTFTGPTHEGYGPLDG